MENSLVFLPKNELHAGILWALTVLGEGEQSTGSSRPLQPVTPAGAILLSYRPSVLSKDLAEQDRAGSPVHALVIEISVQLQVSCEAIDRMACFSWTEFRCLRKRGNSWF